MNNLKEIYVVVSGWDRGDIKLIAAYYDKSKAEAKAIELMFNTKYREWHKVISAPIESE